jgi:hypothetical protein
MNRFLTAFAALPAMLIGLSLPTQARAEVLECRSSLYAVLVYSEGWVNVLPITNGQAGTWNFICNINSYWKGVSQSTCETWKDLLLQLKRDNREAEFYYNVPPGTTCTTLPSYGNAVPPIYIGDVGSSPSTSTAKVSPFDVPPPIVDPELFPSSGRKR